MCSTAVFQCLLYFLPFIGTHIHASSVYVMMKALKPLFSYSGVDTYVKLKIEKIIYICHVVKSQYVKTKCRLIIIK